MAYGEVLQVPSDFQSITEAIQASEAGDTVLIAPGIYMENLTVTKALTLSSWFLTTQDESYIGRTIIDGNSNTVFFLPNREKGVVNILGLTIRNGEDGIYAKAPFNLYNSKITQCEDGIDYESGSGGICMNNSFVYNLDDGIDLDGTLAYTLIKDNFIAHNEDDGIEIRLHPYQGDTAYCRISNNTITNNLEDGIQFIDYPDTSKRLYVVDRNLIKNNVMAGIGFMDQGETREDYRAASIPEPIHIYNNTISSNHYGQCGGGNLLFLNNLVVDSHASGMKNITGQSVIAYCLLYNNGTNFEDVDVPIYATSHMDPVLNQNYLPEPGSPCIDRGTALYLQDVDTLFHLPRDSYRGSAPDIGAREYAELGNGFPTSKNNTYIRGQHIRVSPNPFSEYIRITGSPASGSQNASLQLINLGGMVITRLPWTGNSIRYDTSHLAAGSYLIKHLEDGKAYYIKLIKL
jgi:hypothetical protein